MEWPGVTLEWPGVTRTLTYHLLSLIVMWPLVHLEGGNSPAWFLGGCVASLLRGVWLICGPNLGGEGVRYFILSTFDLKTHHSGRFAMIVCKCPSCKLLPAHFMKVQVHDAHVCMDVTQAHPGLQLPMVKSLHWTIVLHSCVCWVVSDW
jgi:hypothetical protein